MLLTNPDYSCLYSYIKEVRDVIDRNTVAEYKSYDKEKDNYVFFRCFDLKSGVKLNNNIFLREISYEGSLDFSFNKATNEVFVSRVPYVNYANVQVPIFTSDIAGIITKLLSKYIPSSDIKLIFANPLTLLAEDNDVVSVIPSIADTKNHQLLIATLENMHKEEVRITAETLRYKERQERLHRSQERAIAQKRKMYGLDPKEFASVEDFLDELAKKLTKIWTSQVENIERHLKANEAKYKSMLKEGLKDNDRADSAIEHMLRIYLFNLLMKSGYESINRYTPIDRLIEKTNYGDDYTIKTFLDKHDSELTPEVKRVAKMWADFWEIAFGDKKKTAKTVNSAVDMMLEGDLYCKNGVVDTYYRLLQDGSLTERKIVGHNNERVFDDNYMLYELFLRDEYDHAQFHPIFKPAYEKCKRFCVRYGRNYFDVCNAMQDTKMDLTPLSLIVQIDKLRSKLEHCKSLLENPKSAVTKIYQNSTLWGSLMQLPYWNRIYGDPIYDSYYGHEMFSLLMIQPEVTSVDLDKLIKFIDGPSFHQGSYNRKNSTTVEDFESFPRFMVTIPKSLPIEEIDKLIDYVHARGEKLNFVCESVDTAMLVKKLLISKALDAVAKGETYFTDWCFVNVDPTYYESFLVNTPTNKVLWHRYDYSSTYPYRRKDLLSLDRQMEIALSYCRTGPDSMDYWLFDELMLGGYLGNPIEPDILEDYQKQLREESSEYERELKL